MVIYQQLKNAPVHSSMREVSELIYETCKTYLKTQLNSFCCSNIHRRRADLLLRISR